MSAIFTVSTREPEVPVTVIVAAPVVAELLAVTVKTLVLVVLVGLKDAVTPLGRPETAKFTLPLKPPTGLTVIVLWPLLPCAKVNAFGAADSVKPGTAAVSKNFNAAIPATDAVIV